MRRTIMFVAAAGLLAAATLGLLAGRGALTPRASASTGQHPVTSVSAGGVTVRLRAYGLRFEADPARNPPISSDRAISIATANSDATLDGHLLPGVQVTAQYGIFF